MTALALQPAQIHELRDLREVSQKLAEIGHLLAGNEAEIRKLSAQHAIERLNRAKLGQQSTLDLAPILERLNKLEAAPTPAAQPNVLSAIHLLSDELTTLKTAQPDLLSRVAKLEAALHQIAELTRPA